MNDFYRVLKKIKECKNSRFALATVIGVEGSAYRHSGAKMLIGENGEQFGTISAGCLEEDLCYHAQSIIQNHQPETITYDLRSEDDLSWGQGAGCNGSIKVYVEPYEWNYIPSYHSKPFWPQVDFELQLGYKVATAKSMKDNGTERVYLSYSESGILIGDAEEYLKEPLLLELIRFIESGNKMNFIQLNSSSESFLFELYEPREKLFIFGAGPDVEPLASQACALDFSVTIIDPRSERCNKRNFPTADLLVVEHPESYLDNHKNEITHDSFVLIMTHSFQRDSHILQELIPNQPRYLGVLGPRRRTERLLYPDSLQEWIYSPVGLRINAEGPDEIAISIVSQLIQVRNEKKQAARQEKVTN
jgi:xanthine dehydrogenase accessory factor